MKRTFALASLAFGAFLALVFCSEVSVGQITVGGVAQAPSKPTMPPGKPADQVAALSKQYQDGQAELLKLAGGTPSVEAMMNLKDKMPDPYSYAPLFMEIAAQHPTDAAAVEALTWVVRNIPAQPGKNVKFYSDARTKLVQDHLTGPHIGSFCRFLSNDGFDPAAAPILRKVLAENPHKEVQASATLALARLLPRQAGAAFSLQKADEKQLAAFINAYGNDVVAELKRGDPAAMKKESEALFERIVQDKDYAATPISMPDGSKWVIGEMAERELFALRHLRPGKPAPEIVGEDLDGKPMKLSDFRGKVVLLIFSGSWCGPCRAFYPMERDLAEKYKDRPFANVGVCCETDREIAKESMIREMLTWRSFFDRAIGSGPIQRQWNIQGFPELYPIDHEGIIVGHFYMREQDKALIEEKVKAAERLLAP